MTNKIFTLTTISFVIALILLTYCGWILGQRVGEWKCLSNRITNDTGSTDCICPQPVEKTATITAYCLQGTMASGKKVYEGAVACPRHIKLGAQVKIADKVFTCEDRTALKNNGIYDIWFENCDDAINWGRKKLPIKIIN